MSTLTASAGLFTRAETEKAERALPARPASGPVFIYDSVMPAGHSTLLHQLWQRWDNDQLPED